MPVDKVFTKSIANPQRARADRPSRIATNSSDSILSEQVAGYATDALQPKSGGSVRYPGQVPDTPASKPQPGALDHAAILAGPAAYAGLATDHLAQAVSLRDDPRRAAKHLALAKQHARRAVGTHAVVSRHSLQTEAEIARYARSGALCKNLSQHMDALNENSLKALGTFVKLGTHIKQHARETGSEKLQDFSRRLIESDVWITADKDVMYGLRDGAAFLYRQAVDLHRAGNLPEARRTLEQAQKGIGKSLDIWRVRVSSTDDPTERKLLTLAGQGILEHKKACLALQQRWNGG